ncbi:MAG: pseudouridine synthase [Candidatus Woesearchaeota archaeon]
MQSHSLCRVISKLGIMSRKEAAKQVIAGNVTVDGKTVKDPGMPVSLDAKITVKGKEAKKKSLVYILLNKPANVVTTRKDPQGRRTVYDVAKLDDWVFPVGRLDYDTSGLLIMTNDSEFAELVTDPNSKIWKTYLVKIKGELTKEDVSKMEKGMALKDYLTLPAKVKIVSSTGKSTRVEIMIHEGKNRQVRKMLESLGKKVVFLERTAIGNLKVEMLKPGQYVALTEKEINALKSYLK